ncbi:hypothetical protein MKJ04_21940 [Pontibacter sp. E15-1]|uniref:hypothetical protein n=1 Tax=Pontibacter sp. E15-1 TaxID=2919918 RepID=UPI001F5008AA|nr:hypothetical protein [Pontibacter sp. E15-1]MCJ8167519.1 hypothetical protein [Pontibacter sp. E15-1]
MKNLISCIIAVLFLTSIECSSQNTFKFESKINPGKTYKLEMDMFSSNKTVYQSEIPSLKGKSSEGSSSTRMTRTTATKSLTENGHIPATVTYGYILTTANANVSTNPISGTVVHGYYAGYKFHVNEVISDKLDEKTKQGIKHALENVKPDIQFPATPLRIGESFEHKMPMIIPISGVNPVKVDIIKTYTLKSVDKNIAVFDLKEKFQLSSETDQTSVAAKGDGSGIVEFDISENQIIKNNAVFAIEVKVKVSDDVSLTSIIKSDSQIKATIK